jgi:hypothetical protein
MRINKGVITVIVILLVLAGAGYAVNRFYLQPQLEEYAAEERFYQGLEGRVQQLQDKFSTTRPEVVVAAWQDAIPQWQQAVNTRRSFFDASEALQYEPVPEGRMAKFHYEEQYFARLQEIQRYLFERGIYMPWPDFGFLQVPTPDSVSGANVSADEVHNWLQTIAYGSHVLRILADAGAREIYALELWPTRRENGILRMRTTGLSFNMTIDRLAEWMNDVAADTRQFRDIGALRIATPNLYVQNPGLNVELLYTEAEFVEGARPQISGPPQPQQGPGPGAGDPFFEFGMMGPGGPGGPGGRPAPRQQESWWQKLWPF